MQRSTNLLFASVLFAALLPVTVWGYGFYDYQGDRNNRPVSLRVHTGMTEDGYYVRAHIEGLRPEDVQVYLQRNRLVLQTTQGDQYGLHNPNARRGSQWQMSFRRQLRLPYDADATRMTTSTENGIIEIYIPRRSQYMPADPFSENR